MYIYIYINFVRHVRMSKYMHKKYMDIHIYPCKYYNKQKSTTIINV